MGEGRDGGVPGANDGIASFLAWSPCIFSLLLYAGPEGRERGAVCVRMRVCVCVCVEESVCGRDVSDGRWLAPHRWKETSLLLSLSIALLLHPEVVSTREGL